MMNEMTDGLVYEPPSIAEMLDAAVPAQFLTQRREGYGPFDVPLGDVGRVCELMLVALDEVCEGEPTYVRGGVVWVKSGVPPADVQRAMALVFLRLYGDVLVPCVRHEPKGMWTPHCWGVPAREACQRTIEHCGFVS